MPLYNDDDCGFDNADLDQDDMWHPADEDIFEDEREFERFMDDDAPRFGMPDEHYGHSDDQIHPDEGIFDRDFDING